MSGKKESTVYIGITLTSLDSFVIFGTNQSTAKRMCEQKLESSLIKSLLAVGVAQLDHAVNVQISGVARSRYLSMR